MPALTHGRVKNGFNGHATSTPGAKILSIKNNQPRYSIKHIKTAAARINTDVERRTALVGGIGSRNTFVRRAVARRVVKQKSNADGTIVKGANCCD